MPLRSQVEEAWATLESWTVDHWGESRGEDVLADLTALETNLLQAERDEAPS
ncbi:MAG: hypothetical protein ACRDN9_11165 [Streptosporangiaceae bacterium]